MTLTNEQQEIFDRVSGVLDSTFETNVVIHVDAKAGTGKTTLAKYIVDKHPGKEFIYTAFNKKIVEDGREKFGDDNCKTFHALAYKYTGRPKIGGFYPPAIRVSGMQYITKKTIVDMLDKYCLSRHLNVEDFCKENFLGEYIEEYLYEYLGKMADRSIPITFNYMLKELHHNLADGERHINLDILFVDEAQDLTPVMLEIFGLIQADVKVYLGDTSQDIYSFLDLVSAFTLSKETYNLTESFRLSADIAKRIEPFCKDFIDPNFKLVGLNMTPTDISEAYITHSNAEIIEHVIHRQRIHGGYSFTRPVKEIFEVTLEVNENLNGDFTKNPKYWALQALIKKKATLTDMINSDKLDDDIISSLKLLKHMRKINIDIYEVLEKASRAKPDNRYLIGTAHSVKGLEFGKVTISRGLNKHVESNLKSTPMTQDEVDEVIESCKLYYVACSRAKHVLENALMLDYKK